MVGDGRGARSHSGMKEAPRRKAGAPCFSGRAGRGAGVFQADMTPGVQVPAAPPPGYEVVAGKHGACSPRHRLAQASEGLWNG